jgi:hypothetical protein
MSLKDRIREIKRGRIKPETTQEWAIFHAYVREKNLIEIQRLHNQASINKPNALAGKIVCVPPKRGIHAN